MNRPVDYPGPGCVVEFLHSDRPQTAWVLEAPAGRVRVLTQNMREMKLPAARVLPWAGPARNPDLTRQDIVNLLKELDDRRQELAAQVDPDEIWELAQGEVLRASLSWFAQLVFDDPDADHLAAVGRALLTRKTHFRFQPPDFEVHPAEKVEARLAELALAKERERVVVAGQTFFQDLWSHRFKGRTAPVPPEDDVAARLAEILKKAMAERLEGAELAMWNTLRKPLPDQPLQALALAKAWGLVDEHHNWHLDLEGYDWGDAWAERFANLCADHAARLEADAAKAEAESRVEPEEFVSIDSATTRDIDDAFFVERNDGGFRLRLALACPALYWEMDSDFDGAVRERASSIYLPEGTSHMLPEDYGIKLFSLAEGQVRPALILDADLDGQGRLTCFTPSRGWVRTKANITYDTAQDDLDGPTPDPNLAAALDLARLLRAGRIENGAVIVDRPDPKIILEGTGAQTKVHLEQTRACPDAQLMVSEFMILANAASADWGMDLGLPLLFRTQDTPLPKEAAGVWEQPEDSWRVVRLMGPTLTELKPRPHSCLAVPAYSPVTSPLRRYSDLLNQIQMVSHIDKGGPALDHEALKTMMPYLSSRAEAASRLQRYRPRYWKLAYFRQNKNRDFAAVVVDADSPLVTAALPEEQLFVRAPRRIFGDKLIPGQRFRIRLNRVDPVLNEIRVSEAWEE